VARIIPEADKESTGRSIAKALANVQLTDEEFAAWRHDLEEGRKMLLPPEDKWE
jgi:hypothetical protein